MRPLALILRAGAVVVLAGVAVAAVVDGAPHPVVVQPAIAAGEAGQQPEVTTEPKRVAVPKRQAPSALVTIAATGDIVMGSTPNLPPDGGRSFFSGVQADLAGDVVVGNLEGTLSTGGTSKCGPSSTSTSR